ncbi:c-type cytochrome [Schlesneria sp. T3-172]|uniref:c-type cytochrome n=1 Tax=Schlesneria sphaerica TaxID=3373610 RepID=UPI0037C96B96
MNWKSLLKLLAVILAVSLNECRAEEAHRSPLALAISPDGTVLMTANQSSGTVTLVDVTGQRVLSELPVGRHPFDVVWVSDSFALVSLLHDDAVAVVKRDGSAISLFKKFAVGDEPSGLAMLPDRSRVFVALGGEDQVAAIQVEALISADSRHEEVAQDRPVSRIDVGGIPRTLAVSPDGRWLVTFCSVPCEAFVHDTATLNQISARKIFDGGFNPGKPVITADSQLVLLPSAINRAFSVTAGMIDIGWVIDNRLTKLPLPDGEPGDQKQLGLDIRGKAVGDANAVALSPDGKYIAVTCGGTHELLVLEYPSIPWPSGDPGDFLPEVLRKDPSRYRRIPLGGRPVDVQFLDQRRVIVANHLGDSLQVVDLEADQVENISLGAPAEISLVRRGEIAFYDANWSMHSWFSCHTCHTDGHTSGQVFDTRNDRTYGTPKLIPTLRGVAETGPWTWHGWQTDLKDAMRRSLIESMSTEREIADEDVAGLAAYLSSVSHPENPRANHDSPAITLGRQLFEGRAGCVQCHSGNNFTTHETFDGAVIDPKDANKLYNPPSLRGVSARRRFLHTGKARSLEQVLKQYHRPEDVVGEALNDEEVTALVEYLKTL